MPAKKTNGVAHEALKMHTHVVIFKRDSEEERVAIKAQAGKTTKAIAREMGMTVSEAQYRILKAQRLMGVRFRAEYRNGGGCADLAERAIAKKASRRIQQHVTPKLLPYSVSQINQ